MPVLYEGPYDDWAIRVAISELRSEGSRAVPGWAKPEGIVVYHTAARTMFKVTIEGDEKPKGSTEG